MLFGNKMWITEFIEKNTSYYFSIVLLPDSSLKQTIKWLKYFRQYCQTLLMQSDNIRKEEY